MSNICLHSIDRFSGTYWTSDLDYKLSWCRIINSNTTTPSEKASGERLRFSPINKVWVESVVAVGASKLPILINLLQWPTLIVSLVASYLVKGVIEDKVCGVDMLTAHRTVAVIVVEKAIKNPVIFVTPWNKKIGCIVGWAGGVLTVSYISKKGI